MRRTTKVVAFARILDVILKQKGKFTHGYRTAKEKIVWTAKEITQAMLNDVKVVKPPPNKDFNMFNDTFDRGGVRSTA
jgi:hypothetical protein